MSDSIPLSNVLLCNFRDDISLKDDNPEFTQLWKCDWISCFIKDDLKNIFEENAQNSKHNAEESQLLTAISFLCSFVQENFTGPNLNEDYKRFLDSYWPKSNVDALKLLEVDSEELNANVKFPEFLLVAKIILEKLHNTLPNNLVINWWILRLLCIHQKVLDELTGSIYKQFEVTIKFLLSKLDDISGIDLKLTLLSEICNGYLVFHRTQKAADILSKICNVLGIEFSVEGILGKRTKFQQKDLPQLCLKLIQKNNEELSLPSAQQTNRTTKLPELIKHEDDVLLEKIQFSSKDSYEDIKLNSFQQVVVLTKLRLLLRSQPKDKLAAEEIEPYLTSLIYQEHGPVFVRLISFILTTDQEKENARKVERSLKQCEEVLHIIDDPERYSLFVRFSYIFSSGILPRWEIEKRLGDLSLSLGLVKTALEYYLKTQSWEEVIDCYTRLDLRHKAAEVIRQELDKNPTVKMFCLLGDATDDISCYQTAWEFSNEKSGRAQRHWGNYYFDKKKYKEAMPYLEKSLEINTLQEKLWLRLGFSAIMLEKWETAVQAYLRYTHLEPYGFESWNNLAKALIKLGDKNRAHKMLSESLKCNFNNWKVWENFMLVSVDTGHFEDVLNAYNRLIELKEKEKFVDVEVLEIVVKAIAKNIIDAKGRPSDRLRKKANDLLAHQCVQNPGEGKLWELAALLAEKPLSRAQKLQKAYQNYLQKNNSWSVIDEMCLTAIDLCRKLCETSLEAADNTDKTEFSSTVSQLSSTRLAAQGCIRRIDTQPEKSIEVTNSLNELKNLHERITEKLKSLK